jgi:hypothetical protein
MRYFFIALSKPKEGLLCMALSKIKYNPTFYRRGKILQKKAEIKYVDIKKAEVKIGEQKTIIKRETAASLYFGRVYGGPVSLTGLCHRKPNTNLAKSEPFTNVLLFKVYTNLCHRVVRQVKI